MARRYRAYPQAELEKMKCFRCGKKAKFQWNACADGNVWRPLCAACDVALNVIVVSWLYPKDWVTKIKAYCKSIGFRWKPPTEEQPK